METLQELMKVCKPRSVRLMLGNEGKNGEASTLISQFYDLLQKEKLEEKEIVVKLYGEGETISSPRYQALKRRLKRILYDVIAIEQVKFPSFASYEDVALYGTMQLQVSTFLMSKQAYLASRELLLQTWSKVHKYENTRLNYLLAMTLAPLYLGAGYDEKKYTKFCELALYYREALFAADTLTIHHWNLKNAFYAVKMPFYDIGKIALKYTEECESVQLNYPEVGGIQGLFTVNQVMGYLFQGKYNDAKNALEQGQKALANCKGVSTNLKNIISLYRLECTVQLKRFEEGKLQIAEEQKNSSRKNKIKFSEYAVRLGLKTGEYTYAYEELLKVNFQRLSKEMTPKHLEYWFILEAWGHFFLQAGKVKIDATNLEVKEFKLGRFINSVPSYSRLKKGVNIQILILQISFFLLRKEYDKVIDRADALSAYCNRYLRENENLRHNCFFKLLLIMIKANFHRAATERKAAKTLKRMQEAKNAPVLNDTELVPYEDLWEILLEQLGPKPA